MATASTSLLGLALPVTGDLSGTWGDTVNNSITSLLDSAVAGTTTLSTDADVTLSTTVLGANQARQPILLCSGARTALRTITAPAQSKIYSIINSTTGGFGVKIVGVGPTTGVTLLAGESALVAWNGSDFAKISGSGGTVSYTNLTVTGTTTLSGLTASTALALDASKNIVSVTNTGTGNNVLATSPVLVTPDLGTPSALTLTNATGLPGGGLTGFYYQASSIYGSYSYGIPVASASGTLTSSAYLTWTDKIISIQNAQPKFWLGNYGIATVMGAFTTGNSSFHQVDITYNAWRQGTWYYNFADYTSVALRLSLIDGAASATSGNTGLILYSAPIAPANNAALTWTQSFMVDFLGNMVLGSIVPTNYSNYTTFTLSGTNGGRVDFNYGSTLQGSIYGKSGAAGLRISSSSALTIFTDSIYHSSSGDTYHRFLNIDTNSNLFQGEFPHSITQAWNTGWFVQGSENGAVAFGTINAIPKEGVVLVYGAYASTTAPDTGWIYTVTSYPATKFSLYREDGSFRWYVDNTSGAGGVGGNPVTWLRPMTLDASRNLLLNTIATPTSAVGTFAMGNATAPTASIVGGILYVDSGALKYLGQSGTVTTIAVA